MKPETNGPRAVPTITDPENNAIGVLRSSVLYMSLMTPPTMVEKTAVIGLKES
jgi:hypothetical protein